MRESRHHALYRRLLALYPRWFRRLYGEQMQADFAELLASRRELSGPWGGAARAWALVVRDLSGTLPREWIAVSRRPSRLPRSTHSNRRGDVVRSLLNDALFAVRTNVRNSGFTLLVVATLAVGIGINVAMFSVVDAVLLSPLPYSDADRLAMVWNRHASTGSDKVLISGPDLLDYGERATTLEDFVYIHNAADHTLTDGQRAEQVEVAYVSSNLFDFLGVGVVVGRTFSPGEEERISRAMDGPALISHELWASRYGSDPAVVGRTIQVGGRPAAIVGVLPPDFDLVLPYREGGSMSSGANEKVDIWRILPDRGIGRLPRSLAIFRVVTRVRGGLTFQQARAELNEIAARLRGEHRVHEERGTEIELAPLHAEIVGPVRAAILSLFGAVAILLVLACANVANLVSVRCAHRQREVAIRAALGATRVRLIRQLLTENIFLAGAGAVLGVILAAMLIDGIVSLTPANVPMLDRVVIDARALAFAVAAGSVATILFGVLPALRVSSSAATGQLGGAGRSGIGGGHRIRSWLVIGEVALSLVLLVGGGLLVRSFLHLQRAHLGFQPDGVVSARIAIGHGAYDDDDLRRQYWEALLRRTRELPGVRHAGFVAPLPFGGQGAELPYSGARSDEANQGRFLSIVAFASAGYFEAMQAEVLDGRTFEDTDWNRTDITVIDDIAAERLFPGGRAVGRSVWLADMSLQNAPSEEPMRPMEIIGVVRHIRHSNVTGDEREVIYRPAASPWSLALVVQTAGDPNVLVDDLHRVAEGLDRDIPLFDVRPMSGYIADRNATTRFTMTLGTAFGAVALLMSAIGLYGVIAFVVEQRTSEMGLRMALGATPTQIVRLVLTHGGALAGVGTVIGLATAFGVARLLQGLLVGVTAHDPTTFLVVPTVLLAVTVLAAWVPARRAARMDPLDTLRAE